MEERPIEFRFAPKNINYRLVGDLRGNSTVASDQILISLKVLPCKNVLIHRAVHTTNPNHDITENDNSDMVIDIFLLNFLYCFHEIEHNYI